MPHLVEMWVCKLCQGIAKGGLPQPSTYSIRNSSIGSTEAALRAGR